jgi:hypothetical protein
VVYGDRIKKDRAYETAMHRDALPTFRNKVN